MDDLDSLNNYEIDYSIFNSFDRELIFEYKIMPLFADTLFFKVATSDENLDCKQLAYLFQMPIKPVYVPHQELQFEWKHYPLKSQLFSLAIQGLNTKKDQEKNSFIKEFLDLIIEFSIINNASDIHFEVIDKSIVIRLRIDGVLKQYFRFCIDLYPVLSSIIKYLGNLDISQKRLPLNSRFSKKIIDKSYDIRVSTMPTILGESIVLRILDNSNAQKNLSELGFDQDTLSILEKNINLKQGLILVTGPTGSGKTTTLYSMLQKLNKEEKKIITVEDPVEYKMDGIVQVNINEDIELNYHHVLKNTLRQDPDILMIGEIRDIESLKIALQASLTGHLVIATLHTNNSIETLSRLQDLGAESYLIEATLKMVLSQRLLRLLCDKCKEKDELFYKGKGCHHCNYTGYYGREVISECVAIDKEMQNAIASQYSTIQLEELLKQKGIPRLEDKAKGLLQRGKTTPYEFHTKI
jgi:general secretion pathway protein E